MTLQPRRHYGDPAAEYRAAVDGCGVVVRADRRLLRVHGRAPVQMLNGIVTSRIPEAPVGQPMQGEAVYGTILTAKGRMVTDLVTVWLGAGEEEGLGLSVAEVAHEAVLAHFGRFLPPRLARVEDRGAGARLLTLVGPRAGETVAAAFGAAPADGFALLGDGPLGDGALVARGVRQVPSWDVWVGADAASGVWDRLRGHGAVPVGAGAWHTLRVEAGFPEFGIDMDDGTIPVEAGLVDVAFDHDKGCYTGQEVIVRIRHRGRVNWHLRALRFGDSAARPGAQLFEAGGTKVRGRVTSVADSPRFGQVVGLGYVRREVEPPATLRLGSGEGAALGVEACRR
ncbi:MAG: aminomethyl transferase family protein [Gemmatimonadetes bacterium]|nr:aminomethyl transferase family protein [Gemmatimonadota bacterium]MYG36657.1 aminomethyl transferase family protein [Gemmatimonadota bacterium]